MRIQTIVGLVAVAGMALAGCSSTSVDELKPGACFDVSTDAVEISQVPTIDCAKPHDAEAFYTFDLLPDSSYDEEEIFNTSTERCLEAFEGYVGVDFYDPAVDNLDIFAMYPLSESWEAGEHGVVCSIVAYNPGEKLTGSQKGAFAQS